MAKFSTVSLIRESPEIVAHFARYYLAAGASEVVVFYDGPVPFSLEIPGLTVVACDAAFWAEACGERPVAVEERQSIVYGIGKARCRTEWMLVVDADEYVFGDRPIPAFLDAVPEAAESIALPTAEAVWGPGDALDAPFGSTHFRLAWRWKWLWRMGRSPLYGTVSANMRWGLLGHVRGKQFLRADRDYSQIRNHDALRDGAVVTRPAAAVDPTLSGMFLGHFDAISLAHWAGKWRRRITGETVVRGMANARTRQMRVIGDRMARGEPDTRRLFRESYALSAMQYAVLRFLGFAFKREIFGSLRSG